MKSGIAIGILTLGLLSAGCGTRNIPGMDIEVADTPDHRALIDIMHKFQQSFEQRDIDGLMALASPKFYEKSGTNDTDDDFNYDGLRQHYTEHFKIVEKCNLTITLKEVKVEQNQASIDYRFLSRYLMKLPSGEKWQIKDDINKMILAKEDGQWKILSGM